MNKTDKQESLIVLAIKKVEKSIRSELKKTERVLRGEMLRVEERLENKIDKNKDEIMTSVSNFAGRVETLETENEIGSDQIRKLDERITALEPAS